MNFYVLRFNLYLLLAVLALTGCKTKNTEKDKHTASLRFYIESHAQTSESGETVSVLRSQPVMVTVNREPVLTEANIIKATLLETPGGFAIEVKFDDTGSYIMEQFSSANPGRHFAIFSQWTEKAKDSRWIAAPIISHRNATGTYSFTPDVSRDEAKQIVTGLNNMAKQIAKGQMKL
jgi:preprotein translocase subunit SecD